MIEIKRSSLLMRYLSLFEFKTPRSLCQLGRQIVASILLSLLFAFGFIFATTVLLVSPVLMWFNEAFQGPGTVGLIIWIVVIATTAFGYLQKVRARRKYSREYSEEEPSLFRQWVQAKKQKICPIVVVVD